jgi:4-amino-4-deoxy-L-arabinose transferase-like glycosyltransferase
VLTPFWAATTWWFLLSFETRRAGWAALAGLAAGAAMLGKYWSIFLLAGLGLAALTDPRRAAYFGSAAPWLTIAIGAALLAPHVIWIATHRLTTVD